MRGADAERIEAERIVRFFDGRPTELIAFLSGQLNVLKNRAQVLAGMCGLVITVTGFSGHNMVRAGTVPAAAMLLGIAAILIAAILTLRAISHIRWVSQDLQDDLLETVHTTISRRNRQHRTLGVAAVFVCIGLGSYLASVALAALSTGGALPISG